MMTRLVLLIACAVLPLRAEELKLPVEAVSLLPAGPLQPTRPGPEEGTIAEVPGAGAPTPTVWRLTSPGKLEKSYNLAVSRNFIEPIEKDQVCLAVIKARVVETADPGGKGRLSVAVQNRQNYSDSPLWRPWVVGREWDTTYFAFAAQHALPAGAGVAKIHAGEAKQVVEVADLQVYRFPVGFSIYEAPRMRATYEGRELEAPWRREAAERIGKLRQGDWTIRVVDAAGAPVAGAKVKVAMKRHLFGFGSAVDVQMLSGLDSRLTAADAAKYRATVDELFSRVVPENGLRVGNLDGETDPAKPWMRESQRRMRAAVLWTLQWAQDRRMTSRGHYLVWGYAEEWARAILARGGPAELLRTYDRHFDFVIPFVADYVEEWDALNHPVPFDEKDALYRIIGPDIYPDLYRRIRPRTPLPLYVNEDNFNADRTDGFEKHVRHMIERGAAPDGCGFQSHYHDYEIPGTDEVWRTWQRFGALVKYLTVTEYDFQTLDDALHADHLRDMLTLAFSHPQMTGFVIWGFWEKRHWKPTAALFRADWAERPAVKVWRDLVKTAWWTNAELTTDAKGEAPLRAFYGWYDVTAERDGATKSIEVKHAVSGGRPTITLK